MRTGRPPHGGLQEAPTYETKHQHDGKDLDFHYAEKTMQYVERIWGRPVHLETKQGEKTLVLSRENGNVTKR